MYHPEIAYEFGKERVLELERSTLEPSALLRRLAHAVRRLRG